MWYSRTESQSVPVQITPAQIIGNFQLPCNVIGLLAPKLLLKQKAKVQELTDCVCFRYKREMNYRTISLMPMYVYKISSLEFQKNLLV